MRRRSLACLLLTAVVVLAGCAPNDAGTDESSPASPPATGAPSPSATPEADDYGY